MPLPYFPLGELFVYIFLELPGGRSQNRAMKTKMKTNQPTLPSFLTWGKYRRILCLVGTCSSGHRHSLGAKCTYVLRCPRHPKGCNHSAKCKESHWMSQLCSLYLSVPYLYQSKHSRVSRTRSREPRNTALQSVWIVGKPKAPGMQEQSHVTHGTLNYTQKNGAGKFG